MKKGILTLCILSIALLTACTSFKKNRQEEEVLLSLHESDQFPQIPFSLDGSTIWSLEDDRLKAFDVWDIDVDDEVPGMIFFYARTHEELKNAVEKNKGNFKMFEYSNIKESDFDELLTHFDKEYFKEHILLFYYKYEPNVSENYVYNVVIKDETLILNVNRFEGMATALSFWIHTISLKKEDVETVNDFHVVVRTVSHLQETITFSVKQEFIRDVYINGLDKEDFKGLDNLKSVHLTTSGMILDIYFNQTVSTEKLNEIIKSLEDSTFIKTIGYRDQDKIRVIIADEKYDMYFNNELKTEDLLSTDVDGSNYFTLEYSKRTLFAFFTLKLEEPGKENADKMLKELTDLAFPFVHLEEKPSSV